MPKSQEERPDTQGTPEPALGKRTRRQLTPEYKLRILAQPVAASAVSLARYYAGKSSTAASSLNGDESLRNVAWPG